jgi:hypothetical protein
MEVRKAALAAGLLVAVMGTAHAQQQAPRPAPTTPQYTNWPDDYFAYMIGDRKRLEDGRAQKAMEDARRSVESFRALQDAQRRTAR